MFNLESFKITQETKKYFQEYEFMIMIRLKMWFKNTSMFNLIKNSLSLYLLLIS